MLQKLILLTSLIMVSLWSKAGITTYSNWLMGEEMVQQPTLEVADEWHQVLGSYTNYATEGHVKLNYTGQMKNLSITQGQTWSVTVNYYVRVYDACLLYTSDAADE